MLNPRAFYNSRPDGFGVLEVAGGDAPAEAPRRFVPLKRTDLAGEVTGSLAALRLTQTFALPEQPGEAVPIEAVYRFPLPGDAAVTGVRVRFGTVEIQTTLKERAAAEQDYDQARKEGRQAALVTRESPDVFTLAVAGIRPGQDVQVETQYVQLARPERDGWSLRVPLTTSPRYVRQDEAGSRHAAGQPLALLRDPGHRFALDLTLRGVERVASPTHALAVDPDPGHTRVRLRDGEVIPDRDCVLTWRPAAGEDRTTLRAWVHADTATGQAYFLALCAPPAKPAGPKVPREVVLLVDHSGSMEGPKWEAADWAVERFLAGLTAQDTFALGLFHDTTRWFAPKPTAATPAVIGQAVEFLKKSRDSGGTELGVALEQALDLPRADGTASRHVLVITDAEVSDAGRLLRLAEREAGRADRRRVSVLCIDAAPNAGLATELAERGGGVSRFLTSNPEEDDITTALDEVLADWSAPVLAGLTLEVNRPGVEAAGRQVALVVPGPGSAVDLGDLPAGRPVWAVGRAKLGTDPLAFRLRTGGADTVAEFRAEDDEVPGLKALFGADRVRRLEYLMHSGQSGDELRSELQRLGYDPTAVSGESKVYAENARDAAGKAVRQLLVREALDFGLPSSETAFVAVRSEAGQPVGETVVVANALPSGWSERFLGGGGRGGYSNFAAAALLAAPAPAAAPTTGGSMKLFAKFRSTSHRARAQAAPPPAAYDAMTTMSGAAAAFEPLAAPAGTDVRITVAAGKHASGDGAVLYDSARDAQPPMPDTGRLTSLSVAVKDPGVTADTLDPGLALLVYVGDLAAPRARVVLADVLRAGGRRPLNVRREAGQVVRIAVEDPNGRWAAGVPPLEVVLGWSS